MKKVITFSLLIGSLLIFKGCTTMNQSHNETQNLTLETTSFQTGNEIGQQYTCDGADISPELSWRYDGDEQVGHYLLIVDDPDAQPVVGKTFVHWIAVLPGTANHLKEDISGKEGSTLHDVYPQAYELANDFDKKQYGGPCPPKGDKHRYVFTLFALNEDAPLDHIKPYTNAKEATQALDSYIIAQAQITGTYKRQ